MSYRAMAEISCGAGTGRPHAARVYGYCLGGKDHFAADREAAGRALARWPAARTGLREHRRFLARAVRYLAAEAGARQFLDIGAGLPTADNVHEIAQRAAPQCRVVYVDNDPMVLAHARALLVTARPGGTACLHGDLRDPLGILDGAAAYLDLSQPVAVLLADVLPFLADEDRPEKAVRTLLDALPPGSYLAASHLTPEHDPEGIGGWQDACREAGIPLQARDPGQFAAICFDGLELVPPGVVLVSQWRPCGNGPAPTPAEVGYYGGVGRKLAG